ncbi:DUF1835 domain-containing protein [Robbsia sp. Bb-Pol-6]|uniref:DUF1835 domain-containing protein n=1 Tax=Robbsia betulipollinis TaxID=2981849 RepID=A0ABT3ZLC1_9BURK|nr:DUF1835 domain-containing protein [Robbsia betulipollinis]MCY0386748.1 DUF1835 domain-containing protein [Robbsia betulipollinis]
MPNHAFSDAATHGHIDLDIERKRAKTLLRLLRDGSAPAQMARLTRKSSDPARLPGLSDAQWLIAQDLGFADWPKLKAHVDALAFAAAHPGFAADDERETQHWRCGNDIAHSLRTAGFQGAFQAFTDPLCMGPVRRLDTDRFLEVRSRFVSQVFSLSITEARNRLGEEYRALAAIGQAERVVLWCDADAYDQLFLVYVLANARPRPKRMEVIAIDRVPGVRRFIGIGQLAPSILAWLWQKRRVVDDRAFALAREAWDAYRAPDPLAWAEIARRAADSLPFLGSAMRRQLQELPSSRDGLSLTQRLTLETIRDRSDMTLGKAYGVLMLISEPLPFLGDAMYYALIRPLIECANPLLHVPDENTAWERRPVTLTELGRRTLAGDAYWLDHADESRWIGGICVSPRQPHWTIDDASLPVWRDRRF